MVPATPPARLSGQRLKISLHSRADTANAPPTLQKPKWLTDWRKKLAVFFQELLKIRLDLEIMCPEEHPRVVFPTTGERCDAEEMTSKNGPENVVEGKKVMFGLLPAIYGKLQHAPGEAAQEETLISHALVEPFQGIAVEQKEGGLDG